jgi:hypothetical protein
MGLTRSTFSDQRRRASEEGTPLVSLEAFVVNEESRRVGGPRPGTGDRWTFSPVHICGSRRTRKLTYAGRTFDVEVTPDDFGDPYKGSLRRARPRPGGARLTLSWVSGS